MDVSEVVRENKTNMTSEEQVKAIIRATRELEEKKTVIYEQLMGELEPKGIRLINFNKLSAEEGKILEESRHETMGNEYTPCSPLCTGGPAGRR